jgi:hypothetical protein
LHFSSSILKLQHLEAREESVYLYAICVKKSMPFVNRSIRKGLQMLAVAGERGYNVSPKE